MSRCRRLRCLNSWSVWPDSACSTGQLQLTGHPAAHEARAAHWRSRRRGQCWTCEGQRSGVVWDSAAAPPARPAANERLPVAPERRRDRRRRRWSGSRCDGSPAWTVRRCGCHGGLEARDVDHAQDGAAGFERRDVDAAPDLLHLSARGGASGDPARRAYGRDPGRGPERRTRVGLRDPGRPALRRG